MGLHKSKSKRASLHIKFPKHTIPSAAAPTSNDLPTRDRTIAFGAGPGQA
ncbi:MAG: hypothetical protein NVSMB43_22120 [Pseudarthrobacter sp.]